MITPKVWGFEDEIINTKDYCGKRMFLKEQHRCSIHKHDIKDEALTVVTGLVWFETGDSPDRMVGHWMKDAERIHIKPGLWHRFTGMRDSIIYECSTHHEDSDSIRHITGGELSDDEFRSLLTNFVSFENQSRIMLPERAGVIAASHRADGRSIGMVNGCFDLMHLGHVELLRQARFRCEVLFVAVNTDRAVKELKGAGRPFMDEVGRMGMVESCRYVDYVVEADDKTCVEIATLIRPDVYITTSEYGSTGPEAKEVVRLGGTVEVVEMIGGYNTSAIARSIRSNRP